MEEFVPSRAFAGLALAVALTVACEGETEGPRGVAPSMEALLREMCRISRDCCELDGFGSDALGSCEVDLREQWGLDELLAHYEAGTVEFDQGRFNTCFSQLDAIAQSCTISTIEVGCLSAFRGTVADGASCLTGVDCESPTGLAACWIPEEDATLGTTRGTCVAQGRGKLGDGCSETCAEERCGWIDLGPSAPDSLWCFTEDGLYCHPAQGTCQRMKQLGESCTASDRCAAGSYCSATNLCTRTAALGEECTEHAQCEGAAVCLGGSCRAARIANAESCGAPP